MARIPFTFSGPPYLGSSDSGEGDEEDLPKELIERKHLNKPFSSSKRRPRLNLWDLVTWTLTTKTPFRERVGCGEAALELSGLNSSLWNSRFCSGTGQSGKRQLLPGKVVLLSHFDSWLSVRPGCQAFQS